MSKEASDINYEDEDFKDKWSKELELNGAKNFRKVSDNLYRSAQPSKEGMESLKELGIRTIINLRSFHSDRSKIGLTGLAYEHIYTKTWNVEEKEIVRFLQIVSDPNRTPALVHCMQGVDRTGTMCALYRIIIEGWDQDEALAEMRAIGHNEVWKNLPKLIKKLDIEKIKKMAGLDT